MPRLTVPALIKAEHFASPSVSRCRCRGDIPGHASVPQPCPWPRDDSGKPAGSPATPRDDVTSGTGSPSPRDPRVVARATASAGWIGVGSASRRGPAVNRHVQGDPLTCLLPCSRAQRSSLDTVAEYASDSPECWPILAVVAPDGRTRQRSERQHRSMSHTTPVKVRTVVGNISLSLDGRTTGPGGDYDMGWIVPHALTDIARAHLFEITMPATTVLLGRKTTRDSVATGRRLPMIRRQTRATVPSPAGSPPWKRSSSPAQLSTPSGKTRIVDADPMSRRWRDTLWRAPWICRDRVGAWCVSRELWSPNSASGPARAS